MNDLHHFDKGTSVEFVDWKISSGNYAGSCESLSGRLENSRDKKPGDLNQTTIRLNLAGAVGVLSSSYLWSSESLARRSQGGSSHRALQRTVESFKLLIFPAQLQETL